MRHHESGTPRAHRVRVSLLLLMVILLLVAIGTLPAWPYSTKLGYYPSCVSGAILFGIALMVVAGRL